MESNLRLCLYLLIFISVFLTGYFLQSNRISSFINQNLKQPSGELRSLNSLVNTDIIYRSKKRLVKSNSKQVMDFVINILTKIYKPWHQRLVLLMQLFTGEREARKRSGESAEKSQSNLSDKETQGVRGKISSQKTLDVFFENTTCCLYQ